LNADPLWAWIIYRWSTYGNCHRHPATPCRDGEGELCVALSLVADAVWRDFVFPALAGAVVVDQAARSKPKWWLGRNGGPPPPSVKEHAHGAEEKHDADQGNQQISGA
jgi:hypothetical protein